jgi:hypothetical protein
MKYIAAGMLRLALDCQRLFCSTSLPADFTGEKLQAMLENHVYNYSLKHIEQHGDHTNGQIELRVRRTESLTQEAAAKVIYY